LLQRFRRGSDIETLDTVRLLEDGWSITQQQGEFEIEEWVANPHTEWSSGHLTIATGHIDGVLERNGHKYVYDIKSLHPNVWNRIDSVGRFKRMGSFWAKYPRQLLLYMYAHAEQLGDDPVGLFILDDCLGHLKVIGARLWDWAEECEDALRTARAAAIAIHTGEPPPFCEDPDVCQSCWARECGVCSPPMKFEAPAILPNGDELSVMMDRLTELEPSALEYAELDDEVKCAARKLTNEVGRHSYLAGEYELRVNVIESRNAKEGIQRRVSWRRLTEKEAQ